MSEQVWNRLGRHALTRRAGVGAAGLALVGCGDDDNDHEAEQVQNVAVGAQAEQAVEQTDADEEPAQVQAQAMPDTGLVINEVVLAGAEASALLTNVSGAEINLEDWFLYKHPAYWARPAALIPAAASLRVDMGEGATDVENI